MQTRWTIGTRLMLSFTAVALVTLVLGIQGLRSARQNGTMIHTLASNDLPSVEDILIVKEAATAVKVVQRTLLDSLTSPETRQRQYENLVAIRERYGTAWKQYDELETSPQERALWQDVGSQWEKWRAANNKFLELSKRWDATGIMTPMALWKDVEVFIGDHYGTVAKVSEMMRDHKAFDGGEDPEQCRLGKWLDSYKTDNRELLAAMDAIRSPHERMHRAITQIKGDILRGDVDAANKVYDSEFISNFHAIGPQFDRIRQQVQVSQDLAQKTRDQAMGDCLAAEQAAIASLDKLSEYILAEVGQTADKAVVQSASAQRKSVIAMAVGTVAALGLGLLISRGINRLLRRLAGTLGEGSSQVASASTQVAGSSQSLAQGASEQAAALEETTSALEEMSSMTKKNAETAHEAALLSEQTKAAADKSNIHTISEVPSITSSPSLIVSLDVTKNYLSQLTSANILSGGIASSYSGAARETADRILVQSHSDARTASAARAIFCALQAGFKLRKRRQPKASVEENSRIFVRYAAACIGEAIAALNIAEANNLRFALNQQFGSIDKLRSVAVPKIPFTSNQSFRDRLNVVLQEFPKCSPEAIEQLVANAAFVTTSGIECLRQVCRLFYADVALRHHDEAIVHLKKEACDHLVREYQTQARHRNPQDEPSPTEVLTEFLGKLWRLDRDHYIKQNDCIRHFMRIMNDLMQSPAKPGGPKRVILGKVVFVAHHLFN